MVRCRLRMVLIAILATLLCYSIISHISPDSPQPLLLLGDNLINHRHRQKERQSPELQQIEKDQSHPELHPKESLRAPPIDGKTLSSTPSPEQPILVETIENIGGDKDGEHEVGGGEVVEVVDHGDKVHKGVDEIENVGGEEIDAEDHGDGVLKLNSLTNEVVEDIPLGSRVESNIDTVKKQLEKLEGNDVDIERENAKVNIEAYVKSAAGTMDRGTPAGFLEVGKVNPKPTKKPVKRVQKKLIPMLDPENDPFTRTKLIQRGTLFTNTSTMGEFLREQQRRAKNIINICKTFEIQRNREWHKVINTERLDQETIKRITNVGLIKRRNDGSGSPLSPDHFQIPMEKLPSSTLHRLLNSGIISPQKGRMVDTADLSRAGMGPPPGLIGVNNLILDRRNHLTFCPVYKAASTSWSINLLKMNHAWIEGKKTKLQPLIQQTFPKISNFAGPALSKDTTRFLVVRHPFERLLSCYRDKFEGAKKDYYYLRYGEKMVRSFRKAKGITHSQMELLLTQIKSLVRSGKPVVLPHNPFAHPLGPTFTEFANYIAMSKHDDEHWRPFHNHCSPCHIEYDFVLRFENMYIESRNFIEYLNRTNEIEPRWDNPTGGGQTTSEIACSYFNQLTVEIIKNLVNKYKKDFALFEYSPDEYFKCAKDYVETQNKTKISR